MESHGSGSDTSEKGRRCGKWLLTIIVLAPCPQEVVAVVFVQAIITTLMDMLMGQQSLAVADFVIQETLQITQRITAWHMQKFTETLVCKVNYQLEKKGGCYL